ncbi:MAG: hypothetical protein A2W91_01565 [Bacteroidetes bacterium GWF2_38_335]|nr:MAG: hypothetical protein A2W91_01565 [Bacteroidetes bacterium GWF2_38_335]OFY78761.1 MAG: hypothetical protein A2281_19140 [Bacteroidetes bacterium RIFOXYA12_FULL_38_20]HBS85151.1 DUF58 domain-containing protein [Bacteroidales bacterium]
MEASELLKKVRKIEIKTRGLSKHIFAGQYHSAFKGKGMTFSEVREYNYGDSIRDIDWNVTARFNHPYIKIYEEERELTVILIIDVSGSKFFGTGGQMKSDLITEIAAVLSFSAIQNNDKIGVILFSDRIEKFIPPKKGKQHILRIIRELIDFRPQGTGTNISEAVKYFTSVIKKRSTAFVISDFIDEGFEDALRIANRKHDVIAMEIFDQREGVMPNAGLIKFRDAESGKSVWIDTSRKSTRRKYADHWAAKKNKLAETFNKSGIDSISLCTDEDYVRPLINLFKKRDSRN